MKRRTRGKLLNPKTALENFVSNESCPIPTAEQRRFMEIRESAEKTMLASIYKSIADAAAEVKNKVAASGIAIPPTDEDYFAFTAQQVLFVRLCGGDPDTFEGGDAELGDRIVRNGRHIVDHYWRKDGRERDEERSASPDD